MVTIYVEGGGDANALKAECRKGFKDFLSAAGFGRKPGIVACGTRRNAYERFCLAIKDGETAFLLVDSEAPVAAEDQSGAPDDWRPWHHLKSRPGDGWNKPAEAADRHCHLMVECMENWFFADPAALSHFFGQGFTPKPLPKAKVIESVGKAAVYSGLASATKACKTKAPYGKGEHSFKILSSIDPTKVAAASPWAARFITMLKIAMGA